MFKRANKMTALLVAAAAVVSLVPATGVNAADVKRIESKDGTVYNAQAYKDGSFVIDGDVVKEDNDEVYFLKDGKYTPLQDLDSGDDFEGVKSAKYLEMQGGDYFVDLTNGKVTDDNVREDNADDAASALRKNVKKDTDGRYKEDSSSSNGVYGSEALPNLDNAQIEGSKYGDTWYKTKYADKKITGLEYNVYADAKGKYIDADYNIGKIKVETVTGSSVTLKNTDADKLKEDEDTQAAVTVIGTLTQDSKNIYRKATITVTSKENIAQINGVNIYQEDKNGKEVKTVFTDASENAITKANAKSTKVVKFDVIQKISKEQASDDIDGAKYAKTVNTYIISKDNGEEPKSGDKNEMLAGTGVEYTVADGKIVAYDKTNKKVQAIELKSKSSYYYTDVHDFNDDEIEALDTDVDGNLWMVDDGFVYKFDNDEDWDKVYKVDGSMNKLSVYNKDNMVIWSDKDKDDEVYSIIGAKDKEDEKPVVATKGWVQATDGTWTYVNEDGTKATGWLNLAGTWYYMNDNGVMATGWKIVNGTWYYLNDSGSMATGWKNVSGTWYFLEPSGAMKTGWYKDGDTWYYLNANGSMAANTTVDGCNLGANGAWI
ncbi:N-acetylmuramoyl-L-alanine amidase family protein [Clostridium uliginosum]|uniref:Putative cell wall binding repeat-containing protein n=1 Tax=Clostridium uliginosum TaxID=119641 RepID=A0A1I1R8X9_9CLOT|nr:N-acetylmuramoyl-L-alanine amidase family protein [Clostridium uliginosum]SFD26780.1 Putative cell wall binding repeat-containing protein [Clostridium uliginosum]